MLLKNALKICDRAIKILKFEKGLGFSPEFWLRTLVKFNHPGKLFSVFILFIEALNQFENCNTKWNNSEKLTSYSYILFMFLGNYWYTHWWGTKDDRFAFLNDYKNKNKNECIHALSIVDPKIIVVGAFFYYILYGFLFYNIGKKNTKDKKFKIRNIFKTISLWNIIISGNLLLLLSAM